MAYSCLSRYLSLSHLFIRIDIRRFTWSGLHCSSTCSFTCLESNPPYRWISYKISSFSFLLFFLRTNNHISDSGLLPLHVNNHISDNTTNTPHRLRSSLKTSLSHSFVSYDLQYLFQVAGDCRTFILRQRAVWLSQRDGTSKALLTCFTYNF